ncbi:MAG: hypothetical protein HIU86_09720 [Acidobacteria bacterium]|nr:hypothetical protein [Acidobacteriota bacterium]
MNRRVRSVRAALVLTVAVVTVLTGCAAQPGAAPVARTTAKAASAHAFVCPELTEVAALTATPFSSRSAGAVACSYATGRDVIASSTVTVQRLTASDRRTAAALRYAAMRRGAVTADLPALSFDAFSASTSTGCAAWFPAADGVLTAVTARQDGRSGAEECGVADAVATLVGSGSATSSAPTVAVLAPRSLLGTATAGTSWPWRIGAGAGVRIDLATGSGSVTPSSPGSSTRAAAAIPTDSAAVVFVSGTADAGSSRLEMLTAVTAALSAASGRSPNAKLIVVGPVASGATSPAELTELRDDLRSAAAIAGAAYIDPAVDAASGPGEVLGSVADAVSTQLHGSGVSPG